MIVLLSACNREQPKAPPPFVTRWSAQPSLKYDLGCFVGIMTGREFYTRYYPDLYKEWKKKLSPAARSALKTIDRILGPNTPPGPRLCLMLSACAADDSLAAILRGIDDEDAMRQALLSSSSTGAADYQQWHAIRPHFRTFLEFLRTQRFGDYWRDHLMPPISKQLPHLRQELQAFDVIGDLERFLIDYRLPDTIRVYVVRLVQPHSVRLPGQRYVADVTYPIQLTVKSAYHALAHGYGDRIVDSLLAVPFKRLEQDSFLQLTVARIDANSGYNSFATLFPEDATTAIEMWVASRRRVLSAGDHAATHDPVEAVRRYLRERDEGIHVLAAVIYSYLAEGLKKDDQSYADFVRMLFDTGRLSPGKIETRYQQFMNTGQAKGEYGG